MQGSYFDIFLEYINLIFFLFTSGVIILFTAMGYLSTRSSIRYKQKNSFGDISKVMASPLAPTITIIAPAYNEGLNIVENVRSLLALNYVNYEVMIVNDGSKDDTLQKLIDSYSLKKKPTQDFKESIKTKPIRGIYKSQDPSYKKLTVVDKANGGKADALNVGLQLAEGKYVGCIDADCLLHPDALLMVVKAFTLRTKKRVIAVGGVLRVANSCKISRGVLEEINLPKSWLARFQLLEYTRSFLLGRMAWGRADSLLIISGAFGFFDREIALAVNGYDTKTVGEDMEIVFKMRRYMHDLKESYTVEYLPNPLCYTEVPEDLPILMNQRDRWARGNIETLYKHKDMFLNSRYGRLGLISYPYWLFYEWLSPILEVFGLLTILLFTFLGIMNWQFFWAITAMIYVFCVTFSLYAILCDVFTYNSFKKTRSLFVLVLCAFIEPFSFHPLITWSSLRGNYRKFLGINKGWGKQKRKGFNTVTA